MTILSYLLFATLFAVLPAGVIWLCRRYPLLDKIGPILLLYAIGIIIANLPIPLDGMTQVAEIVQSVSIPLAIPMMLFACSFKRGEVRTQLVVIISGFLSVAIAVVAGYMLFGRNMSEGAEVGGIVSGMYTGGTLNAASLQKIFSTSNETFMLINSYDIVISLLYFVFLFTFGIRLFRRLYGEKSKVLTAEDKAEIDRQIALAKRNTYKELLTKASLKQVGWILLATIAVVGVSAAVALIMPEGWFMTVFILMLTTLGVACSFVKPIRALTLSYDIGMYLIYIFSLAIASMADFSSLDLAGGVNQFAFMTFAVFVSLTVHAIFCRVMKVDADSMVVSSVAFINSPPFVPMASAVMKNRNALVTGLAAGVAGYALGNHFGVLMEKLLSLL
jgi:uncharacterized membrane protein